MTYPIRLFLMTASILVCGNTVLAGSEHNEGPSHPQRWPQANAPESFFAPGKIHQVFAAGPHVWLIVDQSSGATTDGPWLVRTDTAGAMQASISMSDIPGLDQVRNWSRTPLTATHSGGIAMLAYNQDKVAVLVEFDMTASLVRHRSLDHLPETVGGLMGLELDGDHWLVVGSQKIVRLNNNLEVVNVWAAENAGFVVAYTMDLPTYMTLVLVQKDKRGYSWVTRRLELTEFAASPAITVATTAARHFLVEVFAPDSEQTVVVMPDSATNAGVWQLITVSATGTLATTAVRIPQNDRKTHETKVFADDVSVHFLSIDARQAWHTIAPVNNVSRLTSQALSLPRSEFEATVTNLHAARAGKRLYVGTNYRVAAGNQAVRAAALLIIAESRPESP